MYDFKLLGLLFFFFFLFFSRFVSFRLGSRDELFRSLHCYSFVMSVSVLRWFRGDGDRVRSIRSRTAAKVSTVELWSPATSFV